MYLKSSQNEIKDLHGNNLTAEQVAAFYDWMDGARKVDPCSEKYKFLSGLWLGLLHKIYRKEIPENSFFEILKSMRPIEAEILVEFKDDPIKEYISISRDFKIDDDLKKRVYLDELFQIGLVKRAGIKEYSKGSIFIGGSAMCLIISFIISMASLVLMLLNLL